jgi:hypothetical protein
MYDSVRPHLIPATAAMVAGYVNGRYQWSSLDWNRFPRAAHVRIDADGRAPFMSDVLDVEAGDATIADAVAWVKLRQARGWWSCCYVDEAGLAALRGAVGHLDVEFWVAHWTGSAPASGDAYGPRVAAVQYKSTSRYDESAVFSPAWFPTPGGAQ